MTREEAIEVLKRDIHNAKVTHHLSKHYEMAIKALEQESCEDAISREKAKQFLYERLDRLNDDELYDIFSRIIDDMYNELPSITHTKKWIPVSERLPEENGGYLVSVKQGCVAYVTTALWVGNAEYWNAITAWMPLPEPYKAESEEI